MPPLRQNRIFQKPPLWTQRESDLLIDMHWLHGMGAASIATRLARSERDVLDRITIIKKRIRRGEEK